MSKRSLSPDIVPNETQADSTEPAPEFNLNPLMMKLIIRRVISTSTAQPFLRNLTFHPEDDEPECGTIGQRKEAARKRLESVYGLTFAKLGDRTHILTNFTPRVKKVLFESILLSDLVEDTEPATTWARGFDTPEDELEGVIFLVIVMTVAKHNLINEKEILDGLCQFHGYSKPNANPITTRNHFILVLHEVVRMGFLKAIKQKDSEDAGEMKEFTLGERCKYEVPRSAMKHLLQRFMGPGFEDSISEAIESCDLKE